MKIADIRGFIGERLAPKLGEFGFKFSKVDCEFKRKCRDLHNIFRCSVNQKTGWFSVWTEVFVVCPEVNRLFNSSLARKISQYSPTFGFALTNEYRDRGSYSIESQIDLESVIDRLESDFKDVALPFYDRHGSIIEVERSLNRRDRSGKWRSFMAGSSRFGLIAAKICNNPDYEEIYRDYCEWLSEAAGLRKDLEKIYQFFKTVSPDSSY